MMRGKQNTMIQTKQDHSEVAYNGQADKKYPGLEVEADQSDSKLPITRTVKIFLAEVIA